MKYIRVVMLPVMLICLDMFYIQAVPTIPKSQQRERFKEVEMSITLAVAS